MHLWKGHVVTCGLMHTLQGRSERQQSASCPGHWNRAGLVREQPAESLSGHMRPLITIVGHRQLAQKSGKPLRAHTYISSTRHSYSTEEACHEGYASSVGLWRSNAV
jgi:hypothetical protein